MEMLEQIEKEKQMIVRCEQSLALQKLKKRKADTRRKIELGGLVIKSGIGSQDKLIIFGTLVYTYELISNDSEWISKFRSIGEKLL